MLIGGYEQQIKQNELLTKKLHLNNFSDFGFTADFKGEILKEIDGRYIGYLINLNGMATAITWDKEGNSTLSESETSWQGFHKGASVINITPIKKEWYKDESNFPSFIMDKNGGTIFITWSYSGITKSFYSKQGNFIGKKSNFRLATKEEVLSIYYEGKI